MKLKIQQLLQSGAMGILDAMGDAISIQDAELRVVYQNPRHIRMLGSHAGELCYQAYQKRDSACPECHLLLAFKEGRTTRRVTTNQHSRLGRIHVEIITSPIRDAEGKIVGGIEAVRDVTERKMMEERFKSITSDLEQKSWKLMAANKDLESFSYTLSHDVKNYLARISLAAQALVDETSTKLNEAGSYLVSSINDSCTALDGMIDAILLLSSTGNRPISQEKVNIGALAQEIANELRCQYPHHEVEFRVDSPMEVMGDGQLLKVMLWNLLGNAWKYSEKNPNARVSFFSEEHDGKRVFVVQDNGIGFDMKEAVGLFKPFTRLGGSEGITGTGIGLATVRRIVFCHGGEIWGEGVPGKGAAFYFTLPSPQV